MEIMPLSRLKTTIRASDVYYTREFKNDLEENLQYLINNPSESVLSISAQRADMYTGDLIGLFAEEGLTPEEQWAAVRMNGYFCSSDYQGEQQDFILPNKEVFAMIHRKHVMEHNIDN